ncbi:MAG: alpha/beta hydrolase [Methanobrevibacter sp.]|nr:alpha/beta hydrolase [Methanobrevibacter sp.]
MSFLTMSDGIKIYYEDWGEGETLLFAHGLNSSHLLNKAFYTEFRDDYRIVFYDQRGHESSDKSSVHMNIKRLAQDLNEIIESLNLDEVTLIGHSMGAATIYNYVEQFGCDKIKRIVAADMSPYMRNDGWKGGIAQGEWSDEDFMQDLDRIFDDIGYAGWYITKNMINPALKDTPPELDDAMIALCGNGFDPFTMAGLWFSLFRTDHRKTMKDITVPFLYIMPETPLYSMEAVDFIRDNVKSDFELANDFHGTSHNIFEQLPCEVADAVKRFMKKYP